MGILTQESRMGEIGVSELTLGILFVKVGFWVVPKIKGLETPLIVDAGVYYWRLSFWKYSPLISWSRPSLH